MGAGVSSNALSQHMRPRKRSGDALDVRTSESLVYRESKLLRYFVRRHTPQHETIHTSELCRSPLLVTVTRGNWDEFGVAVVCCRSTVPGMS